MAPKSTTELAMFCRPPREGKTKTRLIPALGAVQATALYKAFVADLIARIANIDALAWSLWWSEAPDPGVEARFLERHRPRSNPSPPPEASPHIQMGHSLGERMAHTLGELCGRSGSGLILGSDAPTLPTRLLQLAVHQLSATTADVVLGPAADGGYYLVGARVPMGPVFEGVRWSTQHALSDTVMAAQAAGHQVALLPPWYDVDTPADVRLLRTHLAEEPSAAPHTWAALSQIAG